MPSNSSSMGRTSLSSPVLVSTVRTPWAALGILTVGRRGGPPAAGCVAHSGRPPASALPGTPYPSAPEGAGAGPPDPYPSAPEGAGASPPDPYPSAPEGAGAESPVLLSAEASRLKRERRSGRPAGSSVREAEGRGESAEVSTAFITPVGWAEMSSMSSSDSEALATCGAGSVKVLSVPGPVPEVKGAASPPGPPGAVPCPNAASPTGLGADGADVRIAGSGA